MNLKSDYIQALFVFQADWHQLSKATKHFCKSGLTSVA